ncbi:flavodoxin family protein [Prolixibacteraceae bacterium JC049]|nr:flavodoxin family protein [Prolixibacteraceae bacterium JC049]
MKILAINGSPRRGGNTEISLRETMKPLEAAGFETEVFQLGGKPVHGCTACMKCLEHQDRKCHVKNDAINECIQKMIEADAIIIGSPVYFANMTTEVKALMDVAGYVTRTNGHLLKRKVAAAVAVARRAGEVTTFNSINNFFLINQMIVPGSHYWNVVSGRDKGEVLNDEEGMAILKTLGENMQWLLEKINK